MDEKTLQAITALAYKLGTTAEHLWSVLVAQAPVDAAINCIEFIVAVIMLFLIRWRIKVAKEKNEPYGNDEAKVGLMLAFGIVSVITFAIFLSAVDSLTVALFNPEYYAVRRILK